MNFTIKLGTVAALAIASAGLPGMRSADEASGIQFQEFDVSGSVYVDCLRVAVRLPHIP
jgi:hypothetical protein